MVLYSLYIITHAGSLVYHRDFLEVDRPDPNYHLKKAGVFHAVHTITSQISPVSTTSGGMYEMITDSICLQCLQSVTGLKICVISDSDGDNLQAFLERVYSIYIDFGLKNPFYDLNQPLYFYSGFTSQISLLLDEFYN
eukprot:TRINITY_DN6016_c0_g1_i1.p1 TRINITY_DN6016_c0_g1~~TRINITY_DN6016_c0_g1_i1.p1  ORF type:complete len:157 (-),score=17.42 TRINITY_DN6016_c0_g1_i1:34-447(-)